MARRKLVLNKSVTWLSEEITDEPKVSLTFHYYRKFQYKNIVAEIGDFVLISNADSAEPDTEAGCDAARILSLYEDTYNNNDPFRARVQWFSRPDDLPNSCFSHSEPIEFLNREVLEDHRPFDTDISIETIFRKCTITLSHTRDIDVHLRSPYNYICRYRLITLSKRKVQIEPVLEEERKALQYLSTPAKRTPGLTMKTPSSLVKKMSRVSLSEKNWSVSKNDGTKLLLKRAILADKTERDTPKEFTPKPTTKKGSATPKSAKNLTQNNIEDMLSMELQENSDEELPTLVIRQHVPTTPKRKISVPKTSNDTPKKTLLFGDDERSTPTRSGRVKKPINYQEPEISPVKRTPRACRSSVNNTNYFEVDTSPIKRTPRKSMKKINEESDDDFEPSPKTSRTPKTRTPRATPLKTPKTRRIIPSQLTPTLHSRAHSVDNLEDFLKDNKSLPGRESQMEEILAFVRSKLLDGTSGCMYISGVPGTGKTATVNYALQFLKEEGDLPEFQLVEVNGMKIAEPRQAYVHIYRQLTGKTVVWEQACSLLEKRFTNPGPRRTPTVLLVDELDALCTRRQDVLYSIMEWAAHNTALLTVLAVANTMDLPERALAARVASRLGLTRLTFPPYTHTQLQCIVASRLAGANVTPDAVQLIARKVAAVSGDARRALALCSRAIEIAGSEQCGLCHVQSALTEAAAGAAVRCVQACAPAERLMLRAIANEVERTGSDETTLSRALCTAAAIVALDGRPYRSAAQIRAPTYAQAYAICARLAASRLLLLEPKPSEPRLILNISADDVHYATRQLTV